MPAFYPSRQSYANLICVQLRMFITYRAGLSVFSQGATVFSGTAGNKRKIIRVLLVC